MLLCSNVFFVETKLTKVWSLRSDRLVAISAAKGLRRGSASVCTCAVMVLEDMAGKCTVQYSLYSIVSTLTVCIIQHISTVRDIQHIITVHDIQHISKVHDIQHISAVHGIQHISNST